MMSDQGSLAELVGLPEEEESGSSSVMSFTRPKSPWLLNTACQEFIGWDAYLAQIAPTSPPSPPNHHHQLPSSPLWNFSSHFHYDFTIWVKSHPGLPPKRHNLKFQIQIISTLFEKVQCRWRFLDQGSSAEIVGLPEEEEEEESGSSFVMGFPRPGSPWLVNKWYQNSTDWDTYYSQILPMSPVSNFSPYYEQYHYDVTISLEGDLYMQPSFEFSLRIIIGWLQEGRKEAARLNLVVQFWEYLKRNSNYERDEWLFSLYYEQYHHDVTISLEGDPRMQPTFQMMLRILSEPLKEVLEKELLRLNRVLQFREYFERNLNYESDKWLISLCYDQYHHDGIISFEGDLLMQPTFHMMLRILSKSLKEVKSTVASLENEIERYKVIVRSYFLRNSNYQGDERLFEVLQTTEPVVSAPVPKAVPDGTEMLLDSSEQHATVETHSGSEGGAVGTSIEILAATSMVNNQNKRKLPLAICDGAKKSVHLEDLQQHSHKGIEDAARSPDACESTLEPPCEEKGISQWSESKDVSLLEKAIEAEPSTKFVFTSPSPGVIDCSFGSTSSNGCSIASLPTNREKNSSFTSMELDMAEQPPLLLQAMQTSEPVISAPDQLETVPEGVEVTITSSLEQNSTVETHVENKGGDVGTSIQNPAATTVAKKLKKQKITQTKGGRSKKEVNLKDLLQFSHLSLEEAARRLFVSRSTLKRRCREMRISEWSKLKEIDVSKKSVEAGAYSEDVESIVIKAEYGNDIIKLKLSLSSKKADLEKGVATVLNLQVGSFRLKYEDSDGDWVIIASDFNWQDCIGTSRSLGKTTIKLLIL